MIQTSSIIFALAISFFAGMSSLLGAVLVFAFKGLPLKRVAFGLGFSGGIMIYLSFFELIPESVVFLGNKSLTIFYFAIGLLIAYLLDAVTHYFLDKSGKHDDNLNLIAKEDKSIDCSLIGNSSMRATGIFTALAIGLHNFPEGIVTFTSALINPVIGLTMALAVAIHNIPEGFCVSLPVYCSTKSRIKGIYYALVAGLAEPLGALLAFILLAGFFNNFAMGVMLAVVSGIMFYVAIDELIPAAKRLGHSHLSILGTIFGLMFMFVVMFFLNSYSR